jgi:hypothetical protein
MVLLCRYRLTAWSGICGHKTGSPKAAESSQCDFRNTRPPISLAVFFIASEGGRAAKRKGRMKRAKFIKSMFVLAAIACGAGAISAAHAIKLCQLDWLNSWKNLGNAITLPNSRRTTSRGNFNTDGTGGIGIWAAMSDQGSPGAFHTVSGQSFCSDVGSGTYVNDAPHFNDAPLNNKNCWCRMTSPNLGALWVFLVADSSSSNCSAGCASYCAYCAHVGAYGSCTRSAVLTLP